MMRALLWLTEETWPALVDGARELLPAGAELTLLAVEPADVVEVAEGARAGLLGRRHRPHPPHELHAAALRAGEETLTAARARLGRSAETLQRSGRVEREVVAAAAGFDLLLVARDGEGRPGPRSLGPAARFVVDHAPCAVLLVYAAGR
jgi:nucleotide-binding universal stress UspA family protein